MNDKTSNVKPITKRVRKPRKQYSKDTAGQVQKSRDFASARVTRAVKALESVAKLGRNKRTYVYSDEQIGKIRGLLYDAYQCTSDAFEPKSSAADLKIEI